MDENNNINPETNEEEIVQEEEKNNVDFNIGSDSVVVKNMADEKDKSKKTVIMIVCAVVAVLLIGGIIFFVVSGKNKTGGKNGETTTARSPEDYINELLNESSSEAFTNKTGDIISREEYVSEIRQQIAEATTTIPEKVGTRNPNVIVENTTAPVNKDTSVGKVEYYDEAKAQIDAFFKRKFYISGAMYSDHSGDALVMSLNGDDLEARSNFDGTEVALCKIGDKMYLKRMATKQYVEMDDNLLNAFGFSADDLQFEFTSKNAKLYATYNVKFNDEDGICFLYQNESSENIPFFKFYTVKGKLVEIDMCKADGTIDTQIKIDEFSTNIPADQLTVKGYEPVAFAAIFADMM